MTEHEARKLCTDRGRDPDRDMSGPDGPLKAWEMYDTQALADELNPLRRVLDSASVLLMRTLGKCTNPNKIQVQSIYGPVYHGGPTGCECWCGAWQETTEAKD